MGFNCHLIPEPVFFPSIAITPEQERAIVMNSMEVMRVRAELYVAT